MRNALHGIVNLAGKGPHLRVQYGLKTPDALHAATSLLAGCDMFVTNDRKFEKLPDLKAIILED